MPSKEPEIDPSSLLDFLRLVGGELSRAIVLVAAGGTALTLLGVKPSTRDIDFTGLGEDIEAFKRALGGIPHGMKVDTWPGGQVFTQFLPSDYLARSKPIKQLTNIDLRALHPVDIIVTKIGRQPAFASSRSRNLPWQRERRGLPTSATRNSSDRTSSTPFVGSSVPSRFLRIDRRSVPQGASSQYRDAYCMIR